MTIGVWQIVMILGAICYLVSPIVLASGTKRLQRGGYALRSVAIFAVFIAGSFMVDTENDVLVLAGAFGGVVGLPLHLIWSVHRAQDAGLSKWLNLLQLVPLVGLGVWIFLLLKKSERPSEVTVDIFN